MIRFLAAAVLMLVAGNAGAVAEAAPAELAARDAALAGISRLADSLATSRTEIVRQADSLAGRIAELRGKAELTQAEHRTLEEYLREAQRLQEGMQAIDGRTQTLAAGRRELIDSVIHALQGEIESTLQHLQAAAKDQVPEWSARLAALMERKEAWEAIRAPRWGAPEPACPIEADPADSPDQLRMKGDILSDLESGARQKVLEMDARIRSLRDELEIRRKVQELAKDLALLEEPWESPTTSSMTGPSGRDPGNVRDAPVGPEGAFSAYSRQGPPVDAAGDPGYPGISRAMNDPAPRSPAALEQWIDRLAQYRVWLASRADSLRERSDWFYRQADGKTE